MFEFRLMAAGFVLTVLQFCDVRLDVIGHYVVAVQIVVDDCTTREIVTGAVVVDVLHAKGVRSLMRELPTSFTDGGRTLTFWKS